MRESAWVGLALGLTLVVAPSATADVWDVQTDNDNNSLTENELVHGSDQLHDLGALPGPAADEDWYAISQKPRSSYEVVADATSGDIGPTLLVERVDGLGTTVQSSVAVGVGYSRSLRWENTGATAVDDQFVRVESGGGCTTDCGPDDVYRIRAYETTYAIPRFNNSATQFTVLLIQNPASYSISMTVNFWNGAGTFLGSSAATLAPKALFALNSASLGFAAGQSGSITISNTGRYGDLTGKAVALEPATGFTFDTLMVHRPH